MTLVTIGLLMGFAGLVWVLVIDTVLSDRQSRRRRSTKGEMIVKDPSTPESRAA
jgi:hypothetical protein